MRASTLLSLATFLTFAACAPIQNQTHYERWDAYAAAQPQEEEASPEAAPKEMKSEKPKTEAKAPPASPPPPAPPADYSSLGGDSTPSITKTATASRVVKPESEPEDEPIY